MLTLPQAWFRSCRVVAATCPQGDVHQGDENRNLDERTHDTGERFAAGDAEDADRHGDRQLEVVARRSERQGGGPLVGEAECLAERERPEPHDGEVAQQRQGDAGDVRGREVMVWPWRAKRMTIV